MALKSVFTVFKANDQALFNQEIKFPIITTL